MPYKPRALAVMAAPNVIPMADIMLVLLIIFMVITPLLHPGQPVNMANAQNAERMLNADRDDAIIVAITRDGHMFLGSKEIQPNEIAGEIRDRLSNRVDRTVYVRSDARAKYGDVVKAVDQIRASGVENIGMLTEKIPNRPPLPPSLGGLN